MGYRDGRHVEVAGTMHSTEDVDPSTLGHQPGGGTIVVGRRKEDDHWSD